MGTGRRPGDPIPTGQALLSDQFIFLGLADDRDSATMLAETDAVGAADLYKALAGKLDAEGFSAVARLLRRERRDLLVKVEQVDAAIDATVEILLNDHDEGTRAVHDVGRSECSPGSSILQRRTTRTMRRRRRPTTPVGLRWSS